MISQKLQGLGGDFRVELYMYVKVFAFCVLLSRDNITKNEFPTLLL